MSSGYFQCRWHPDDPNTEGRNEWVDVLVLSIHAAASEFVQYEYDNWGWEYTDKFIDEAMRVQVREPGGDEVAEFIVSGEIIVQFTSKFKGKYPYREESPNDKD